LPKFADCHGELAFEIRAATFEGDLLAEAGGAEREVVKLMPPANFASGKIGPEREILNVILARTPKPGEVDSAETRAVITASMQIGRSPCRATIESWC
jgi:hypothetical protein